VHGSKKQRCAPEKDVQDSHEDVHANRALRMTQSARTQEAAFTDDTLYGGCMHTSFTRTCKEAFTVVDETVDETTIMAKDKGSA
jgi:hypothetical protein